MNRHVYTVWVDVDAYLHLLKFSLVAGNKKTEVAYADMYTFKHLHFN